MHDQLQLRSASKSQAVKSDSQAVQSGSQAQVCVHGSGPKVHRAMQEAPGFVAIPEGVLQMCDASHETWVKDAHLRCPRPQVLRAQPCVHASVDSHLGLPPSMAVEI